jgi:hypothetical protein
MRACVNHVMCCVYVGGQLDRMARTKPCPRTGGCTGDVVAEDRRGDADLRHAGGSFVELASTVSVYVAIPCCRFCVYSRAFLSLIRKENRLAYGATRPSGWALLACT